MFSLHVQASLLLIRDIRMQRHKANALANSKLEIDQRPSEDSSALSASTSASVSPESADPLSVSVALNNSSNSTRVQELSSPGASTPSTRHRSTKSLRRRLTGGANLSLLTAQRAEDGSTRLAIQTDVAAATSPESKSGVDLAMATPLSPASAESQQAVTTIISEILDSQTKSLISVAQVSVRLRALMLSR